LASGGNINKSIVLKIKRYIKEDWGLPFVGGFIILLLVAAVFLSSGLAAMAETVANFAYFALVVGVVLQIICLTRLKSWVLKSTGIIFVFFRRRLHVNFKVLKRRKIVASDLNGPN
jgi:hypothetical protein